MGWQWSNEFRRSPIQASQFWVPIGLLIFTLLTIGFAQLMPTDERNQSVSHIDGREEEFNAGFVRSMIRHHSSIVPYAASHMDSQDESVRMLARLILRTQAYEMGKLEGWLIGQDLRVISVEPLMSWVEIPQSISDTDDLLYQARCRKDPEGMMGNVAEPDFLKSKQLDQMRLHEEELKYFLERVRAHHIAALEMARFAIRYTNSNFVRSTAIEILKQQSREVNWIDQMLAV